MEMKQTNVEDSSKEPQQSAAKQVGRPPPIVLPATTNLLALQKNIRGIVTGNFEFRNTRSGTKIVTKEIWEIPGAIQPLILYLFSKIGKTSQGGNTPSPCQRPCLGHLRRTGGPGFRHYKCQADVDQPSVDIREIRTPTTPLYLITLPRTEKSKEIFKLTTLCHVVIRVEAYRAQSGLTQCHNCQQFGHVWANCKQMLIAAKGHQECGKGKIRIPKHQERNQGYHKNLGGFCCSQVLPRNPQPSLFYLLP
jgi:hypothetical protein